MEPSSEQVSAWIGSVLDHANDGEDLLNEHGVFLAMRVARLAYAAGADAELEACCEWFIEWGIFGEDADYLKRLRADRRPKPPSLKQKALNALLFYGDRGPIDTIRLALESLPDD